MKTEYQILAAAALDLVLGDPRWLPHPVRGIALLAACLEGITRRMIPPERLAGVLTALSVYTTAGVVAWGVIRLAGLAHPLAGDIAGVLVIYTTIAARDLAAHSMAVYRPLSRGELAEARKQVRRIVGRDTEDLDEAGISRAAVESVAESTVDGITAPLFYALCFGPIGAMVYRTINTLDSTFGYTTERYIRFGWASARIDDAANFVPARITGPLIAVAAALVGHRGARALRIMLRDGRNHSSPNAGVVEAAMAGALGVQLGGLNYYQGEPVDKPTLGDATAPLAAQHIVRANALMFATTGLFLAFGLATRLLAVGLWQAWRATT